MTLTLGSEPQDLVVVLPRNGDFLSSLISVDEDWPAGVSIELRFANGPTWAATIAGDTASWNRQATDVNAIIEGKLLAVSLWYIDGVADFPFAIGKVRVV